MENHSARLAHFPITLFAAVMGLSGLALGWKKAAGVLPLGFEPHTVIALLAVFVFTGLSLLYGLKALRYPESVKTEFVHPVKSNFFPAISISLILLATLSLDVSSRLASTLFAIGVPLHFVLTVLTLSRWIFNQGHQNSHMTPAWFIPVVGNVLVPIAAVPLGFYELAWFFFSIGLFFWLVLFTILMHRLIFLDPMPIKLAPTLFILIAPPAVAFVSYLKLTDQLDQFAQILYGVALFITLFLLLQAHRFRKLPFFLSWWAYSFPLAAISIASFVYFEHSQYRPVYAIAICLLALTTVLVTGLLLRTLLAAGKKQICLPE